MCYIQTTCSRSHYFFLGSALKGRAQAVFGTRPGLWRRSRRFFPAEGSAAAAQVEKNSSSSIRRRRRRRRRLTNKHHSSWASFRQRCWTDRALSFLDVERARACSVFFLLLGTEGGMLKPLKPLKPFVLSALLLEACLHPGEERREECGPRCFF